MTPRQRFLAALRGAKCDRVPLWLQGFEARARTDIARRPDPGRREIAERILDQTPYFVRCRTADNRYLLTAPRLLRPVQRVERDGCVETTTEIATPRGKLTAITCKDARTDTVWTRKYPVGSLPDIETLRSAPWEPSPDAGPPQPEELGPDFGRRGIVMAHISSPFVCVAGLMRFDYFLELCATELPLVEELTALCLRRRMGLLKPILAGGRVDVVWIGGCEWLTRPMASLRIYERLVQGCEAELIARIHAAGSRVHVHCHGKVGQTLPLVIARGGDFFEPVEPPPDGDITMAEAKALAAGRLTLGGNVEARLIANGSAQAVEAATRAAFEGGKERLALMTTAGPISALTPAMLANYHRLIDVWEELSPL